MLPRSGLEHLVAQGVPARRVCIGLRTGLALATVMVRKGRADELARRVRERFALDLPTRPCRAVAGAVAFAWAGPDRWLVAAPEEAAPAFVMQLQTALSDLCAVSAQSDGRIVIAVSGPAARAALAKLLPIDLHPRAFAPGDTALTAAGQIGVQIWQLDAPADTDPAYELVVFRSYAAALWHGLVDVAAEFNAQGN
jgi:sarcosine oxidase subunit gamma